MLDKEKAIEIMKERGYSPTAETGNGDGLFFLKMLSDEISIHATVRLKTQTVELNFPHLTWLCFLSTTNFDFFHKEFLKFEEVITFYALRCLGREIKDAMEEIKQYHAITKIPIEKYVITVEDRKKGLWEKIRQVAKEESYEKEMCKEFYEYWTEMNEGGRKMRFEMEKVFDVKRRLNTWLQKDKKWLPAWKQKEKEKIVEQNNKLTQTKKIDHNKLF